MKKINGIDNFSINSESIITLGTFDGVHKGHQKILKKLIKEAKKLNLESIVLTFFPHPRTVLNPNFPLKLINTINERTRLFEKSGIDTLITHPFDKNFSELTPEKFVKDILVNKLNIKKILIGYDHRFGKNRTAGIKDLKTLGLKYNFKVIEISVQEQNNVSISSTKIRNSIIQGNIKKAKSYLGYDFSLKGKVVKGNEIGRTIGFPTANLEIEENYKLIPKNGVYLIYTILEKQVFFGMMNIGVKPTLKIEKESIEVNLFDWEKDIYGEFIEVFILDYIRDETKFDSLTDLTDQIKIDKKTCLKLIEEK
ncbi:MAG: bifunctional riboflavin kinase/FAD synthetase [Flavobacteriaceae bacterium]|jgi:riboflavin kinase/FMN adenylyltransferase|nr:bifunctional riboflavin kinase/FAD synthetase [Flavobacteriaceae bacterium]MBT4959256.1 bifunctional riboflavin kinase/FAD synthetase [Flavobacteriaceae bacterium]MBT6170823.1 bifunctional riboflavin kinase/FAD synthetase [Flavobacteriaceae bacterium]MBT6448033.1 bifunctional riboflavin kinase/FAD synthetase [Flavobacteriaceae bacterium]MBT7623034.1 bifunctional riboflavin kinase/FAD synthetase [Flavobacteriaceae bacterium]